MKEKRPNSCHECGDTRRNLLKKFVYETLKMWLCIDCFDFWHDLKPGTKYRK